MPTRKTRQQSSKGFNEEEPVDSSSAEGTESEDDLSKLDPSILGKAVVFGTDWTAATLIDQLGRGNIRLDPVFQRRDAWTATRKSRFIESIVLGLPIPQIVLAESPDSKGSFLIIDGKQRLLSLQQFAGVGLPDEVAPLRLTGLTIRTELNAKGYEDLKSDSRLQRHLNAFDNQPIRTVVVKNWQQEGVLYLVFHRLNSESLPLSPQELRQALHPGPFLRFAASYTENVGGLHRALGIQRPDFRMRDVELFVRYFAFQNRLKDYSGNLKDFLDTTCKLLNSEWKSKESGIKAQAVTMETALNAAFAIFDSNTFRKWDGERFERRFNRAIFDVMLYFLSQEPVRRKALSAKGKVRAAFQSLCQTSTPFLRSIETTTKSREATETRFREWKQKLEKTLSIKINMPILQRGTY